MGLTIYLEGEKINLLYYRSSLSTMDILAGIGLEWPFFGFVYVGFNKVGNGV